LVTVPAPPAKPKPLPTVAAIALSEGRRIEATKLLRQAEGCDLKTAYARINEAILADPVLKDRMDAQARELRRTIIFWAVLVDLIILVGIIYWFFRKG
jgi:hypothetical protein